MTERPDTTAPRPRRWDLVGLAGGLALGVVDWTIFALMGVEMRVAGSDVALLIGAFFTLTYAFVGVVLGRLVMARARARADAETIVRQLAELDVSRRAAAQSEKLAALGRVAAGIAHEVRNPLGVIKASASLIGEELERDGDAARACRFIVEETDRLDRLIDGLLSFARPGEPRLAEVDVGSMVAQALRLAGDESRRRGVALESALAPELPRVMADVDLVGQAVFGLVVNAVEAVERGGTVLVRAAASGDGVAIEVADSGPGLSADEAALVFEPFYTTKPGGTGLGLAVTARIIERHGGRIEALQGRGAGPNGQGACFHLELPALGPGVSQEAAA